MIIHGQGGHIARQLASGVMRRVLNLGHRLTYVTRSSTGAHQSQRMYLVGDSKTATHGYGSSATCLSLTSIWGQAVDLYALARQLPRETCSSRIREM